MRNALLDDVIAELRSRNEQVPCPMRLPSETELAAIEEELALKLPDDYRKFMLEASDVALGTLEPATATNPEFHTHLPSVVASAHECGVPHTLLPICEDNGDFYCLEPSGAVRFWSHNGSVNETWPSLAHWLKQVWLGERA
jgi:hypothetical protein